ncbi:hypothetical protein SPRG_02107 [Saprolegnia parasitica CBS 223.65]|uniref:Uncharacterized protein n=1 Tax=Saprolegnia parasitica (strain CBS 223.65) TaxID=695850 RepID=A0A067CS29_SAPPC|nr:hypothetical protein SPRG_02107 [Saprolegnia parasitica CBS 223.65]KDO33298.1 hypothetical protein SPRG_02107 [Saprolegnia parasitica CBS 223.65]|eukprot:XP_012196048.1 hypothetical protein SPRG_02107 [Saprolegnia parasitica CBS 223.65]
MKAPNGGEPKTPALCFPILGGFYDDRDERLIADATTLRCVTVGLCIISFIVGITQLTSGLKLPTSSSRQIMFLISIAKAWLNSVERATRARWIRTFTNKACATPPSRRSTVPVE